MGWQDDPIAVAAAPKQPWENDAIAAPAQGPRYASGVMDALRAGYQGSIAGLVDRGKLPDVALDPQHAKWYEKLAAGASQMFNEGPEMLAGAAAGGVAGSVVPGAGTVIGAGVGGFAVPTLIRQSLIESYKNQQAGSAADWASSVKIIAKETGKDALVGGLTAGTGLVAKPVASVFGLGAKGTAAAVAGSELTTMTVSSSLLHRGELPEPEDFLNAAILLGGMKGATYTAGRMMEVYRATGKTPAEQVADAKADPKLAEELSAPAAPAAELPTAYRPLAAATAAADAFPGTKAQQVLDTPFAALPEAKLPYEAHP